ncbi:MAG: prepilin peptidase [Cyanophyceae cyanobacterium]
METLAVAIASLFVFVLGASIGSFINVVAHRLPAGISLIFPPSRCPHCCHRLGARENLPVVSWLWLRGRCRWCQASISIRYPLVEAAAGCLFFLVFWQFGISPHTLGYWILLSWLLALSLIDLETMTLPNVLTRSCLLAGLGFQAALGWYANTGAGLASHLMTGIASAVVGIWLFDTVAIAGTLALGQTAMGGGDPKLAAAIGAWVGWQYLLLTSFLACAFGAVVGGAALYLGWLDRKQPLPFGPFLAGGAASAVLWGEAILSTYLAVFFPFR